MKKEILEKLKSFVLILLTFLIDGLTVISFGLISKSVTYFLELINGKPLSELNNNALTFVYNASKYILAIFFVVFVGTHLFLEIKKSIKKISTESE